MFDDLFSCMSVVAGGTLTAAEMLNKKECNVAINWQGGWHHAQRYSLSATNHMMFSIMQCNSYFYAIVYSP